MTHPREFFAHNDFDRAEKLVSPEESSNLSLIGIVGTGVIGAAAAIALIKGRSQISSVVDRVSSLVGRSSKFESLGEEASNIAKSDFALGGGNRNFADALGAEPRRSALLPEKEIGLTTHGASEIAGDSHIANLSPRQDIARATGDARETAVGDAHHPEHNSTHDITKAADIVPVDRPVINTDVIRKMLAEDELYADFHTPKPGKPDLSAGTFFAVKDPAEWDSKLDTLLRKLEEHRANPKALTDDQIRDFWGIKAEELDRKIYGTMHDGDVRGSVAAVFKDFRFRDSALEEDPNSAVQWLVERHDHIHRDDNAIQHLIAGMQPREGESPTLSGIPFIEFKNEAFRKFIGVSRDVQYAMDPARYMDEMGEAYSMNPSWRENMFNGLEERLKPEVVAQRLRDITSDYETIVEQGKLLRDPGEAVEDAEKFAGKSRAMLVRLEQWLATEQARNGRLLPGPSETLI